MDWIYTRKYWKRNTDIFTNETKDLLEYREGYSKNIRDNYSVNSKAALMRKIYKDYLNLALDEVVKGNVVVVGQKGVTLNIKVKKFRENPYEDIYKTLNSKGFIPSIYLNTGEFITVNKEFLVIPNKERRASLLELIGSGSNFTKLRKGYYR